MALKEYKPGTAFPGVIGPHHRRVEAGVAGAGPRQGGRAERAVHRPRRHRLRPARLLRQPDRDAEPRRARRRTGCATTTCTRRRCARRRRSCILTGPQPSLQRDGLHHRGLDRAIPAATASSRSRTASCPRCCCSTATTPTCVGKWHLTPSRADSGRRALRPLAARARLRALLRLPRRRHAPVLSGPRLRQPPGRAAEDARRRATTSRDDLVDKAIGVHRRLEAGRPRQAVLPVFLLRARRTRPHHVPKEWADKYKGKFDDGWDAYREKVFAQAEGAGHRARRTPSSRATIPTCRTGASCPPTSGKLYARMMEVFAGFLEHTDHHIGRLIDFLEDMGELDNTLIMVISDNGASAEGGPTGSVEREQVLQQRARADLKQNLAAIDELGGPKYFNHYPWGWTCAGNTPFRRWKRETYRGGVCDPFIVHWPKGIKAKGEVRRQYRARHRHGADRARRARARAADARSAASRSRRSQGVSFAHVVRRRRRRRAGTTRSTSRCSATARSITTAGGRSARGRARRSPRRAWPSARRSTEDKLTELDAKGWELYHVAEDFAENHNVAADNRDRSSSR